MAGAFDKIALGKRFWASSTVPLHQSVDYLRTLASVRQSRYDGRMNAYRCEATSVEGFIQQLAVAYLTHGYWFYVTGVVPEPKDPTTVDRKLIELYGIDRSKWAKARDRRRGVASLQYLRHARFFVLLATHGTHPFFEREANAIRDARRTPIRYAGYSVSFRGGHAHVRMDCRSFLHLKKRLVQAGPHLNDDELISWLNALRLLAFAPVRRQLLQLLAAARRDLTRPRARLDYSLLNLRRRPVRPFE